MAATSPTIEMRPKASLELLRRMTSSTISSVPVTIKMISGRKRIYSTPAGEGLTGMCDLCGQRLGFHPKLHVYLGLVQNARGGLTHRRQERLRIHAHPKHHGDQRNSGSPLARLQIGY